MTYRVVVVDMDDTFLRPDKTYDRERFAAIKARLDALSVRFVVASGNQHAQLASFFEGFEDVSYVAENGHVVVDCVDGVLRPQVELPREVVLRAIDAIEAAGCGYVLSGVESAYIRADSDPDELRFAPLYYHRLKVVDDPRTAEDAFLKFAIPSDRPTETAAELAEVLGDDLTVVVSGTDGFDLNAPGVNKATGLTTLLAGWGLTPSDAIAFGDSGNDVEMLRAVGHAVATANARPETLAVADEVAPSCEEDGVLQVLERVFPA